MSWNNQGGGPWRPPGRGPWGQGPSSGPPTGDLEEIVRRVQEALSRLAPGGGSKGGKGSAGGGFSGRTVLFLLLAAVLVWFAWGTFYTVQPNEVGINLVLGRYTGKTAAGLNTNWPWPIGSVIKVPVWDQQITEVGYRSLGVAGDVPEESQMLTGDKNIVDVEFSVFWRIKPKAVGDFLFNVAGPASTVKAVAESAMRQVIGRSDVQPLLTGFRSTGEAVKAQGGGAAGQNVGTAVEDLMQKILDSYNAGILVQNVQIQKIDPPSEVIDSFLDVQAAQSDLERAQNEAQTYANRVVPEARGRAAKIIQDAEAYRSQTVAEATGQASRFTQVYQQYKKAPDITRQRIYLETMEQIFASTDKTIIDTGAQNGPGVLPFLPLGNPQPLQRPAQQQSGGNQ